jgi:hypothetical protein
MNCRLLPWQQSVRNCSKLRNLLYVIEVLEMNEIISEMISVLGFARRGASIESAIKNAPMRRLRAAKKLGSIVSVEKPEATTSAGCSIFGK